MTAKRTEFNSERLELAVKGYLYSGQKCSHVYPITSTPANDHEALRMAGDFRELTSWRVNRVQTTTITETEILSRSAR